MHAINVEVCEGEHRLKQAESRALLQADFAACGRPHITLVTRLQLRRESESHGHLARSCKSGAFRLIRKRASSAHFTLRTVERRLEHFEA